jgi:TusA-related sulfurtransferase
MTPVTRLDVTRDRCPMTWVRTKLALEGLAPDGLLEVMLAEGEMLVNVPRNCAEDGHDVVKVEPLEGGRHLLTVRKRGLTP